ncbi:alpha/beta fold hydrolase [Flavobacterium sp.]|uniref:alpha/beta fold hydrolase n=1 Tax=Flavobacterium sp. TaxID=239 RepID=UPI003529018D
MKTILYKNAKIKFTDNGKGKAIVLLHGFLENSTMWQFLTPKLTENYRVVCIDLLGHGQSENIGYIHTMDDMADAVYEVLVSLKIEKATFIGHSMGGYVSLAFAELFPKMIRGLILLNSTSKPDSDERKANRDRAIKAVKQNYVAAINMAVANLFSEENRTQLIAEINYAKQEALKTPLQGIIAAQEGMKIRPDREILLHTTSFPKLLLLGKKDPVLNFEECKQQVENTDVVLIAFPDGHMSHLENKLELEITVLNFMKQIT